MNVLICDDDASTRFVLRRILSQNLGWSVAESGDGVDALAQLSRKRFDLLLLDLEMPAFSGFEVLEVLRQSDALKDLPVVVVSQERRREIIMQLREQHIAGYLLKPIRAEQVADRLAGLKLKSRGYSGNRADISSLHVSTESPAILAEGNLDYRHFFCVEAERYGAIRVADSAASALAQYRKGPVDVVFIGSKLGVMSAEMLLKKLRETSADKPVRIVGIVDSEKAKQDAQKMGFDDVMTRSFVPAVFNAEFKKFTRPSGPVAVLGQLLPDFESAAVSAVHQVFGMMLGAEVETVTESFELQVALQSTITMDLEDRLQVTVSVYVSEAVVDEVNGILIGPEAGEADRVATTSELVNLLTGRLHAHAGEQSVRSVCSLPETSTKSPFETLPEIPDNKGYVLRFHTKESKAPFAVSLAVTSLEEAPALA
ncbi:MAG: response regulator [Vicinamibacterales bacterium]